MVRLPLDELESLGASDTGGKGLVHEGLPLHSTGSPQSVLIPQTSLLRAGPAGSRSRGVAPAQDSLVNAVFPLVVGVDGSQALHGRGDVGEPGGPADVLHFLEFLDSSVEDAAGKPREPQIGFPRAPLGSHKPSWALKTN